MTLPLASLRELEEQLRAALAAVGAARRSLDDGQPTRAAVELDRIDVRLGVSREVVHDLLETAGQAVERAPLQHRARLTTVLAEWRDDARRACEASGVSLVGSPEHDGHFELDGAKVRRLLGHLVSAALVRGAGQLELRCSVAPDGPTRALIAFEAVRRPPPRGSSEPSAAELLATRLAQVLGGRLEKTIPADRSALVLRAAVPARILPTDSAPEPVRLAGARVLVVEDDDDARAALSMLLEDWELDVVSAASFDEAVAAFDPRTVRLALLDVDLNGRSGFELRERLCARQPSLPTIFLSGSDSHVGLATGRDVRYLVKPVDVPALESAIRELLEAALAVGADR